MIFKVAILQMRSRNRDIQYNISIVIDKMEEAKRNNADLLLLPECFITGYDLTIGNESALAPDDLLPLCEKAKELQVGVIATAITKDTLNRSIQPTLSDGFSRGRIDGKAFIQRIPKGTEKTQNAAFVIDKNGEILMKYAKVHTCDFADEKALASGDEFKVCDFGGVKLSVMICYDREYPESARILMLKGAEIILVPNDCESMKPRVQALSTRAYENMCGVAMANPNGRNAGNSCAFSPICWDENGECTDNTLLLADAETEGLFYAAFDMESLRSYREREMLGNTFRKVKAYAPLLDEKVEYPFVR